MDLSLIKNKLAASQSKNVKREKIDYSLIFFKPKPGKYQIRILPSKFDKSNPFREIYFHYGFSKGPILALTNWNEKDPIADFAKNLRKSSDKEDWQLAKKIEPKLRYFVPVLVRGEEAQGVRFWGFGKTVYQELLSVIADPDYGDITDPVSGRDVAVEFKTAEETGKSFPSTSIRVKPNQTPIIEDKAKLEAMLDNQKNIADLYQELSYEELTGVLNEWLNPSEEGDETKKEAAPVSATITESTKVEDTSAAFDELFNK